MSGSSPGVTTWKFSRISESLVHQSFLQRCWECTGIWLFQLVFLFFDSVPTVVYFRLLGTADWLLSCACPSLPPASGKVAKDRGMHSHPSHGSVKIQSQKQIWVCMGIVWFTPPLNILWEGEGKLSLPPSLVFTHNQQGIGIVNQSPWSQNSICEPEYSTRANYTFQLFPWSEITPRVNLTSQIESVPKQGALHQAAVHSICSSCSGLCLSNPFKCDYWRFKSPFGTSKPTVMSAGDCLCQLWD